jgi:hypothetical protein
MQITRSLMSINGIPPTAFPPSKMLRGDTGNKPDPRVDIPISPITIGSSVVEMSATTAQLGTAHLQVRGVVPLTLEMSNEDGARVSLPDIPFEVVANEGGETKFNSERQETPWRFLLTLNPATRQLRLSLTLDYSGLSVETALEGARFYEALASGGEFRIFGRNPRTGGDFQVARWEMPPGTYEEPDLRFLKMLEQLAFTQVKTGLTFNVPEQDISFEEANTIAATSYILETGHAQYRAEPWVSISTMEQARSALAAFTGGNPIPMAIQYDGQAVVIFGTHVLLGPVTFFCDRTYITKEDLETLRKDIESGTPESSINIRYTPHEECPVEARYLKWLPEQEARAIRQLPIYQENEPGPDENELDLPPVDAQKAVALLESWYNEDAEEQQKTWELLKVALDEYRLSDRKLFP